MKTLKNTPIFIIATFSALALVTVGCGGGSQSSMIQKVTVNTYNQNGDAWAKIGATISNNNFHLPAIDIPITNPNDPNGAVYGQVSIHDILPTGSEIILSANISTISQTPGLEPTLPNGTDIPVGGLDQTTVIGFPIQKSGVSVYGAFSDVTAMLGVAVAIKEFDNLGHQACPINVMPAFDFGKGIRGIGGIFTGCDPGQSGVAFFVDASAALNGGDAKFAAYNDGSNLEFTNVHPDSLRDETKVYRALYYLNKKLKGKQLHYAQ